MFKTFQFYGKLFASFQSPIYYFCYKTLMWLKISFRQNLQKIERKNFRKKVQKAQKMYQLVEVSFKSMKTLGLFFE